MTDDNSLPMRTLGRTGQSVTIFGLGGEGVLRTWGHEREADELVNRALDLGINYFESARVYAGSEMYYGLALRERRKGIFLTSKTAVRDGAGALRDLETTLRTMRTDYIDLWQFHDLRDEAEWERAKRPDGVLEAMRRAQRDGYVRFIGVTGHHDPYLLAKACQEFDFDTVLLPVNAAEAHFQGFLDYTIPVARSKGMGIVGMKVMCRGLLVDGHHGLTANRLIRFALTQPVSLITVGCDTVAQLEENAEAARRFEPLSPEELNEVMALTGHYASEAVYYRPL